jgi:hypothetical protein
MSNGDDLPFLSRWSRRKLDAKEEAPEVPHAVEGGDAATAEAAAGRPEAPGPGAPADAPTPLPPVESLQGIASEYREFMNPGVDETLKRAALKKLFNDPHFSFASMDKLDTYIDDYSIEDPIPDAMLRMLNQSKSLFLFEDKKEQGEGQAEQAPPAPADSPAAITAQDVDANTGASEAPLQSEAKPGRAVEHETKEKAEPPASA